MKQITINFYPAIEKYKGHLANLKSISYDIAKYNGGCYPNVDVDEFIENLFLGTTITYEKSDGNTTYHFGHMKRDNYVEYGKIIKTQLF